MSPRPYSGCVGGYPAALWQTAQCTLGNAVFNRLPNFLLQSTLARYKWRQCFHVPTHRNHLQTSRVKCVNISHYDLNTTSDPSASATTLGFMTSFKSWELYDRDPGVNDLWPQPHRDPKASQAHFYTKVTPFRKPFRHFINHSLGSVRVFERSLFCSPRMHLFDQKYSENSNTVNYYNYWFAGNRNKKNSGLFYD